MARCLGRQLGASLESSAAAKLGLLTAARSLKHLLLDTGREGMDPAEKLEVPVALGEGGAEGGAGGGAEGGAEGLAPLVRMSAEAWHDAAGDVAPRLDRLLRLLQTRAIAVRALATTPYRGPL